MQVILIAAMSRNRAIGKEGKLPWALPGDLKRFRALTRGFPIVMGRKTYESIGRPLPDRLNLVLTRDPLWSAPGVERISSLADARARAGSAAKLYVIGGGEIYAEALEGADVLELTEIAAEVAGDAFFPPFDRAEWLEVSRESQQEGEWKYDFVRYVRAKHSK